MTGVAKLKFAASDDAYSTAVLHAAKHVGAVHGLLLGNIVKGQVLISMALPVAHSALVCNTAPVTEMALRVAEAHAKLSGLQVVGVYFAAEVADDTDIPVLPTRLADLVREEFESTVLLVLDAKRLHPDVRKSKHCFRVYTREDQSGTSSWGKGVRPTEDLSVSKSALEKCGEKLKDLSFAADIVDFEDHCNDPRRRWIPELPTSAS